MGYDGDGAARLARGRGVRGGVRALRRVRRARALLARRGRAVDGGVHARGRASDGLRAVVPLRQGGDAAAARRGGDARDALLGARRRDGGVAGLSRRARARRGAERAGRGGGRRRRAAALRLRRALHVLSRRDRRPRSTRRRRRRWLLAVLLAARAAGGDRRAGIAAGARSAGSRSACTRTCACSSGRPPSSSRCGGCAAAIAGRSSPPPRSRSAPPSSPICRCAPRARRRPTGAIRARSAASSRICRRRASVTPSPARCSTASARISVAFARLNEAQLGLPALLCALGGLVWLVRHAARAARSGSCSRSSSSATRSIRRRSTRWRSTICRTATRPRSSSPSRAGAGVLAVARRLGRRAAPWAAGAMAVLLCVPAALADVDYKLGLGHEARNWTRAALDEAPPRARVLVESDDLAAGSTYEQYVAGARPDVAVLVRQQSWDKARGGARACAAPTLASSTSARRCLWEPGSDPLPSPITPDVPLYRARRRAAAAGAPARRARRGALAAGARSDGAHRRVRGARRARPRLPVARRRRRAPRALRDRARACDPATPPPRSTSRSSTRARATCAARSRSSTACSRAIPTATSRASTPRAIAWSSATSTAPPRDFTAAHALVEDAAAPLVGLGRVAGARGDRPAALAALRAAETSRPRRRRRAPLCQGARTMRRWILVALVAAGCGHAHEAEVVSSYEPRATIGQWPSPPTRRASRPAARSARRAPAKAQGARRAPRRSARRRRPAARRQGGAQRRRQRHARARRRSAGAGLGAARAPVAQAGADVLRRCSSPSPRSRTSTRSEAAPWSVQEAFERVRRARADAAAGEGAADGSGALHPPARARRPRRRRKGAIRR